jgi:hypothetical protein
MRSILFFLPTVYCFGFNTHRHLGELTENALDSSILHKIKAIIGNESLHDVSIWADQVKYTKGYYWSKQLHYLDIQECPLSKLTDAIVNKYCKNKCIFAALMNFTSILKNSNSDKTNLPDAFKFLLHFMQDFNQPMHLLGYSHGGNGDTLIVSRNGRNRTINLHAFWDTYIPEYFIKNYEYKYNGKVTEINDISEYKEFLMNILDMNQKIACKVYPNNTHIIFEDYYKPEVLVMLFDNYLTLALSTFKYIFN